jgi:tetratricopeptide (TPR) repeat protein
MSGKRKSKNHQPLSASDLVKIAEEKLGRGQVNEAIESLRSAEAKFKQTAAPGKKVSVPPHIIAAQAALPQLLARAYFTRSLTVDNPRQKFSDLGEAVKYAPGDFRYWLAHGCCCLLIDTPQAAHCDFQKAVQIQPDDELIIHAIALGLLANKRTEETRELLERTPVEKRKISWQRLVSLAGVIGDTDQQGTENGWRFPLLEGMTALARGNYEAALEKFSDWPHFDQNPSDAEAAILATQLFYAGALNFMTQRYQAAYDSFSEAQRLSSSHYFYLPWMAFIDSYCHKIAEQVVETDLPLAVRCWQTVLKISPDDETAKSNLSFANHVTAHRLWRDGDTEGALALWQAALQTDPHNESLLKNLALGFEKLDRKSDGLLHWRSLGRIWRQQFKQRSSEPRFKDRVLKLEQHIIERMIETGQPENEIVSELEAALKLDSENLELRRRTAERMIEIGYPQKALKHLETVERQQGISSDLLTNKASALASLHRFSEAAKTFELAIELDPSNALARRGQTLLLDRQAERADENGDLDRAIETRLKQLELNPVYAPAMVHLGSLYIDLDQIEKAFEWFTRAIANDPDNYHARMKIGEIYLENGYFKQADAEFERAIELKPRFETLHDIAILYLDVDEVKKAIKHFDRAAEVANLDELLDLATHMFDENRNRDADRYLARAKKLDPTHPMPFVIKAINRLRNPFGLLGGGKSLDNLRKDLDFAEKLALTYPEHAKRLDYIRDLRDRLENPLAILGL